MKRRLQRVNVKLYFLRQRYRSKHRQWNTESSKIYPQISFKMGLILSKRDLQNVGYFSIWESRDKTLKPTFITLSSVHDKDLQFPPLDTPVHSVIRFLVINIHIFVLRIPDILYVFFIHTLLLRSYDIRRIQGRYTHVLLWLSEYYCVFLLALLYPSWL